MKITDPQVILNGEKDLIASLQKDLDQNAVKELLKERLSVAALTSNGGQIVVHNDQVAFRLDFSVNLNGSLLFDRNGDLIREADENMPEAQAETMPSEDLPAAEDLKESALEEDDPEEDLAINLPDYDQDSQDTEDEDEKIPDDAEGSGIQAADPGLESEDLEYGAAADEDDTAILEENDGDELLDSLTQDFDDPLGMDGLPALESDPDEDDTAALNPEQDQEDDDISDILKESRDFWEQKKGS